MRSADDIVSPADALARAETQRILSVLDRDVELTRQKPEAGADIPAARKARVEHERAVNQRHHRADVLTEEHKGKRSIGQDPRVIPSHLQSPPSENGGFAFVLLRIFTCRAYRGVHGKP